MATISGTGANYKAGHEVILKSKLSAVSKKALEKEGYKLGKSIFSLYDFRKNDKAFLSIELKKQNNSIYLLDDKKRIIQIVASHSMINGLFNHSGGSSKADTNKKNRTKRINIYVPV